MAQSQITTLNPNGINKDVSPYELPDDKWSEGNNVKFDNDKTKKAKGHEQIFDRLGAVCTWADASYKPEHSTALAKIDNSSILFEWSNTAMTCTSTELGIGTGDFTIECWFSSTTFGLGRTELFNHWTGSNGFSVAVDSNFIYFYGDNKTSYTGTSSACYWNGGPASGEWNHIAITRTGSGTGNIQYWVNGVERNADGVSPTTWTGDVGESVITLAGNTNGNYSFRGYMDEIRFSDSVRYSATFTPYTTALTTDADTLLLIHSDESSTGSTTYVDDYSSLRGSPYWLLHFSTPSVNYWYYPGTDKIHRTDGTTHTNVTRQGIRPLTQISSTDDVTGSVPRGVYKYKVTNYTSSPATESDGSTETIIDTSLGYNVSNITDITRKQPVITNVVQRQPKISVITRTNPAVVATSKAHGLSDGDVVYLNHVGGMTEVSASTPYIVDESDTITNFFSLNTTAVLDVTSYIVTQVSDEDWSSIGGSATTKVGDIFKTTAAESDISALGRVGVDSSSFTEYTSGGFVEQTQNDNPVVVTSVAHGFSNDDDVYFNHINGMDELESGSFTVANKTDDTFEVGADTYNYTDYTSGGFIETTAGENAPILTAVAHGFSDGDTLYIKNVGGMVEITDGTYTVANKTDDTFEIDITDAGGYTPFTLGGTAGINTGKIELSNIALPVPPYIASLTGRKLYRTEAGEDIYKLLTTIADNTTTVYTDDTLDTALGDTIPSVNTLALVYYGLDSNNATGAWNGGVLGGVAIFNNGVDSPQQQGSSASRCSDLSNWIIGATTSVIRPFKQFLVALDTTESSKRYPFRVRWSHPAEGGTVPVSWDASDETKDAGYVDLSQTNGFVIDCLPLADTNIIYKQDSIWSMSYEGGQSIFGFRQLFSDAGILGKDCAKAFDDNHFVVTYNDVYIHNGQTKESVIDGQMRDELFNSIHPDYYDRTFVSPNYESNEMWICFVSGANNTDAFADKAFVYNWRNQTWSKRDLPNVSHIGWGIIGSTAGTTDWSETGNWDTDTESWDYRGYNPSQTSMLMADVNNNKLFEADKTNQFNSVDYLSWVQKTNMSLGYSGTKHIKKIVPRIDGTGTVDFYIGHEMKPNQGMTWKGPYVFTPGVHSDIPVRATGNYIGIKLESTDNNTWSLDNLELHWVPSGNRGNGV